MMMSSSKSNRGLHRKKINVNKPMNNKQMQAPMKSPKIQKLKSIFSRKKNRDSSKNNANSPVKSKKNAVFGVNPQNLNANIIPNKDYGFPIPYVLITLRKELFAHKGHLIEGIFRIAPNHEECKQIEDRLNDGELLDIDFSA